jgi:hypothetical protein
MIPNRRGSGLHNVEVGVKNRILIGSGDAPYRPSVGRCDKRIAHKTGASLAPNPVRRCYESIVGMGSGHGEISRHADSAGIVERRRRPTPTSRYADEIGTLLRDYADSLRKPEWTTATRAALLRLFAERFS